MRKLDSARIEANFGHALTARLNESTRDIPVDIAERLRAARERALAKRRVFRLQLVSGLQMVGNGSAGLHAPDSHLGLWGRIAAFIPLLVLIAGLLAVSFFQEEQRAAEMAAVDAELLVDELPPAAFTDPGFAHFLSTARRD